MSLILEALKKSEAERRLGRAPDLMSPMPVPRRPPSRAVWLWVVVAFAAVSLIAVGWWWRSGDEDATLAALPPPVAADSAPAPASQAPSGSVPDTSAPVESAGAADRLRQPVDPAPRPLRQQILPPNPETAAAAGTTQAEMPADPRFDSVEREALPLPAVGRQPNAADMSANGVTADSSQQAASTPPTATAPAPETLPRLDQLPLEERSALPPLKLSMHVYAALTTDRFVLIDGRRYREGEKISNSLQIIEIRRDGVVLDQNGTSFLLLRP